jgi:RimJ/RimL family protein N-acetyltransferase
VNSILFRPATPEDAEALIAHVHAMVIEAADCLPLQPGEFQVTVAEERELLANVAASNDSLFLVAQEDDRIVGVLNYSSGKRQAMRHVATLGISVRAASQGRGVGAGLLAEAIRRAKASGSIRRLDLMVYADNHRAIRLYERHGFVREGVRRCAIRRGDTLIDEVQMALVW